MTARRPPTPLQIALAVMMPALLVVAALAGLERLRDHDDEKQLRNAGRVINGRVLEDGTVAFIEQKLQEAQPRVVVLGNSLSNTDLKVTLLARRLGLETHEVQRFSVPNSTGPHWFAILKNRVYANGHRPDLVIVLSDLQSLLAARPRSEAAMLNLLVHLEPREPLIDRKIDRGHPRWERIRENRGRMRDRSLSTLRDLSVNLLHHRRLSLDEPEGASEALQRVFADDNTDMALHHQVIPTFNDQGRAQKAFDPAELPQPRDSFVPDIARIVEANGGVVVHLRPPMSPLLPDALGDRVLPGVERRVQRILERRGGHVLDLRGVPMSAGHYFNLDHMNAEGARRFTEATARALDAVGAWAMDGPASRPAGAELLSALSFVEGRARTVPVEARFEAAPPTLATPALEPGPIDPIATLQVAELHAVADPRTVNRSPLAARCSPVRVREDGRLLPVHNVRCTEVSEQRRGRVCHGPDGVHFAASDATAPMRNGRRYTLELDAARSCEGAVWLYPGDRVRLAWAPDALRALDPTDVELIVEGAAMRAPGADEPVDLSVRLHLDGQVVLDDVTPMTDPGRGQWRWDEPLPLDGAAELEVHNPSGRFVLLTRAALTARAP